MSHRYRPRDWQAQPPYLHEAYRSTVLRAPKKPLIPLPQTLSEITGPVYGHDAVTELDGDLTRNAAKNGEPLGERIIVTGRVLDEDGRPVPDTLIEIWQANAAGRYIHEADQHDAPLDPNFLGAGRVRDRRRGPLPLRHDQARRLSLAQPPERLAAQPHPPLAVRPQLRHAPGHADVFPGRSAAARSTRSSTACPRPRASGWSRASRSTSPSPAGRSATRSTSSCAAAEATPMEA